MPFLRTYLLQCGYIEYLAVTSYHGRGPFFGSRGANMPTQPWINLHHITSFLGRRTRRTTRRVPHYKIEADSDAGSDNSTIDENYDVTSIASSIDEGLTWVIISNLNTVVLLKIKFQHLWLFHILYWIAVLMVYSFQYTCTLWSCKQEQKHALNNKHNCLCQIFQSNIVCQFVCWWYVVRSLHVCCNWLRRETMKGVK